MRTASKKRLERLPPKPERLPAMLRSWLTGATERNYVHSPKITTLQPVHVSVVFHFGQPFSVTRMGNGSISEAQTGTIPAIFPAKVNPSMPSKRLPSVSFLFKLNPP